MLLCNLTGTSFAEPRSAESINKLPVFGMIQMFLFSSSRMSDMKELIFNCEKMVGGQFEQGLAQLKSVVETK